MKTEKIVRKSSGRCLNVVANRVESLRINEDVNATARVYDNGCIGVEGKIGTDNADALVEGAKLKLAQGIPYPETHREARKLHIFADYDIIAEKDFVPTISSLLERLGRENPEFLFSNKVLLNKSACTYQSSDGEDFAYGGNQFLLSLAIKYKGSANIMDEFYGCESDYFDEDQICRDVKKICDAFLKKLPQIPEDEVVVVGELEPIQYALQHIIADMYFNNASLLSEKLGQKVFSDKLTVTVNSDPEKQLNLPFFDEEGVINPDFEKALINKGVFERVLASLKNADTYGTETSGSAVADYNSTPSCGGMGLELVATAENLSQLLDGRRTVLVSVTGGGDMTPSGDISLPVIVSYLMEDGKIVGRLPEFAVTGNLFDILGDNLIGVAEKGLFEFGRHKHLVYKAKIVNKAE